MKQQQPNCQTFIQIDKISNDSCSKLSVWCRHVASISTFEISQIRDGERFHFHTNVKTLANFPLANYNPVSQGSQPDEAGPSAGGGNKIDCLKCSTISKFASPALPRPPLCPIWRMQASSRPAATQGRGRLASHGDTVCKTTLALNHDSYQGTA